MLRDLVSMLAVALGVCVAPGGLAGCAAPLPTYQRVSDDEALNIIADRLDEVRTISAEADVALTAPDGRIVHLDGAFVAAPPERARLRAWKFGTPAMDLTVLPEGVWIFVAERDGGMGSSDGLARMPASSMAPAIELLSGRYFRRAHSIPEQSTAESLVVIGPFAGQGEARCEIDRATLTPRRFVPGSASAPGELLLERYALVQGVALPRTLRFRSPDGEVRVRLGATEINTEVPPDAFTPPARAIRAP